MTPYRQVEVVHPHADVLNFLFSHNPHHASCCTGRMRWGGTSGSWTGISHMGRFRSISGTKPWYDRSHCPPMGQKLNVAWGLL